MGRLLDDLGIRIDAASIPNAVMGTDIHIGVLPDEPVTGGSLVEYEGVGMVRRQTEDVTSFTERSRVQVMWRSVDYNTGIDIIREVWKVLDATNVTIDGTLYQRIVADTPPFELGRDANDRWLFAVNFTVTREST